MALPVTHGRIEGRIRSKWLWKPDVLDQFRGLAPRAVALWEKTSPQTSLNLAFEVRKPVAIAEGFAGDSPSFAIRVLFFLEFTVPVPYPVIDVTCTFVSFVFALGG